MIRNTFQLPKKIVDLATAKKPYSVGVNDRKLRAYLVDMFNPNYKGLYGKNYIYMADLNDIYLNSIERAMTSTSTYSVSSISRLVGVEPNIDYSPSLVHLTASPIIRIPSGYSNGSRIVILANSLLRAHFSLNSLLSYDEIKELIENDIYRLECMDVATNEIFKDATGLINVTRNLSTLYRDLMVENHEDGLLDIHSTRLTENRPRLDSTGDWLYTANMTYIVTALAVATMRMLYSNIAGVEEDLGSIERSSMGIAMDSVTALTLIDNTFKDKTDKSFITDFQIDFVIVKKLVDILVDPSVADGSKEYLSIMHDISYAIASVERSIV